MDVPKRVNEIAGFEITNGSHHVRQQRIRGNVERHSKEQISASLVKLTAQLSFLHVKLEHCVAGRKRHPAEFARVPGSDDQPSAVRIFADFIHNTLNLIDRPSIGSAPVAPLRPVHPAEVTVLVGPFVPDSDSMIRQESYVGFAAYKPKQFK
jgi:hypothetical protein